MLDANVGCHLPEIAVVVNVEQYRGPRQKKNPGHFKYNAIKISNKLN